MSTILFTWELGGGMGHIVQMRPLVAGLQARGHRIIAALRDLSRAGAVFGPHVALLQAPVKTRPASKHLQYPLTFAQMLHNSGYETPAELAAMLAAWRNIFAAVRPGLIIFDHSPTALLAARGLSARKITIGSGFCVPPDQSPLPNLRPDFRTQPLRLFNDEQQCSRS